MDAVDRTILDHIQEHGRDPFGAIGAAAGLSPAAAHERVRRLVAAGIVRGWGARVDPVAVGRPIVAFVFVGVDRAGEEALVAAVAARPEVLECHHVTGDWSYLLKLRCASIGEIETLLRDVIKPCSPAVRTQTLIALSSPKETAIVPAAAGAAP